ncbi:MAG TPA: hypothetical protein PLT25_10220 [Acidocella sp.]|nr:hypothetical protein [Acidocella sp.]
MRQIISYIRVSTGKQGKSGLGIEAQREARSLALPPPKAAANAASPVLYNPIGPFHVNLPAFTAKQDMHPPVTITDT